MTKANDAGRRRLWWKKSLWLLLLFIMVFTSGCWDRRELENLAVVLGMGLNHSA